MFEEPTPDGMPIGKAPTVRLIFVSDEAKNIFLGLLSDGALPGIEIGASESEPLFEVGDVAVIVNIKKYQDL